jgi:hypothetical protein
MCSRTDSQCTTVFVFVIKCAGKIFDPSLDISFQFMAEMGFLKHCIWENMVYATKNLIAFIVESISMKVLWSRLLGFNS